MRNRKVRDLAQSEEDPLEATAKGSDGGKTSTSGSSCPFGLSGQSLGTVSKSSGLQVFKQEEDEEKEEVDQQQQQQKLKLKQYQEEKQQDQVRAQRISMHRAIGGADAPPQEEAEVEATATSSNRCAKCNKKLGLTGGFPCRCGNVYCAVHRYSDRHECSFDYRELGANEIRRDNPLIVPSKLKKL